MEEGVFASWPSLLLASAAAGVVITTVFVAEVAANTSTKNSKEYIWMENKGFN